MGTAAARSTDMHVCPASDGPKPHVGGPILSGSNTTVMIGGLPAAVVGDSCTCAGPPDTLIKGSSSVLIAGKPAVRMGDSTAHGGQVILGCFTVLIGD
ncbi:PAAR domain-containing protein [Chryseobacterium shigense]|uniref:Putative Zn-binding protein involved in type VI secretion n=1 Tax=Chryseobacterium shigense TaxID=297244 RepID=A0A841N1Y8_9FLAO|nr:PAAR domain-containing protein [Chryseobacterium shigense]MBB6369153.1 putative Zn-binding protein involved in type VI secretion [Chryseobacterium shigense]